MTSEHSFSKFLKEDFRHRLWVPALSCVVFFLSVIGVAVALTQSSGGAGYDDLHDHYLSYIRPLISGENEWLIVVAVIGATICGLESFSFLFSKQKVDFYHSLPVRREKLFAVRYLNGFLFYAVPSLLCTFAMTGVAAAAGFGGLESFTDALTGYVQNLIIFALFYHMALLASMFCGTLLVAGALYIILNSLGIALAKLIPVYVTNCFSSIYYFEGGWLDLFNYLSPVYLISEMYDESNLLMYLYAVIFAALLLFAALFLYRCRPSEAAGKSLVYQKTRPFFRILFIVPASLYVGLVFYDTANEFQNMWACISVVIFLIILHGITEVVYDFDIRSATKHKKQLAACIVFGLAFTVFFAVDPMGIDNKVPDQASVKEIYLNPVTLHLDDYIDFVTDEYLDAQDYRLTHSKLEGDDLSKFYDLMEYAQSPDSTDSYEGWITVRIRFVKNNGSSEYRQFHISAEGKQAMDEIYACESYRHSLYQIFDEEYGNASAASISQFNGTSSYAGTGIALGIGTTITDESVLRQLTEAYRQDLDSLSFSELLDITEGIVDPVLVLDFYYDEDQYISLECPVYEEFVNTLTVLVEAAAG